MVLLDTILVVVSDHYAYTNIILTNLCIHTYCISLLADRHTDTVGDNVA